MKNILKIADNIIDLYFIILAIGVSEIILGAIL